ncbi:Protein of unknown function [Bacillus cytotoxicus]|nr:Protein of unknown function [Bacillus cytotoxicus]
MTTSEVAIKMLRA